MSRSIKVKVIHAGSIPTPQWSDKRQRWFIPAGVPEELPPRVLLDVSEESARVLASHLYEEIEIAIRPKESR